MPNRWVKHHFVGKLLTHTHMHRTECSIWTTKVLDNNGVTLIPTLWGNMISRKCSIHHCIFNLIFNFEAVTYPEFPFWGYKF